MICSESFLFGDYSDLKNTYQLVRWQNQKTSPGRWSLLGWQVPLIRIWQRANPLSFIAFLFWGVWIGHVVPKPRMPSWKKWRFSLAWNPLRNPTYTYTLYTYTYIYTRRYLFDSSSVQRTSGLKDLMDMENFIDDGLAIKIHHCTVGHCELWSKWTFLQRWTCY